MSPLTLCPLFPPLRSPAGAKSNPGCQFPLQMGGGKAPSEAGGQLHSPPRMASPGGPAPCPSVPGPPAQPTQRGLQWGFGATLDRQEPRLHALPSVSVLAVAALLLLPMPQGCPSRGAAGREPGATEWESSC